MPGAGVHLLPLGRIVNVRFVMQAAAANLGAVESGNANPKFSLGLRWS